MICCGFEFLGICLTRFLVVWVGASGMLFACGFPG